MKVLLVIVTTLINPSNHKPISIKTELLMPSLEVCAQVRTANKLTKIKCIQR